MYEELLFKIGNVVRVSDMNFSQGRILSYNTDLRIVGSAVMRELALLDEFITHFTTGMRQLPLEFRHNGFLRLFSRLGINAAMGKPNYLGHLDLRPRLHKALQALTETKVKKTKFHHQDLADISYSVFTDLVAGDKSLALAKIKFLKKKKYPIFYEFFYILEPLMVRIYRVAMYRFQIDLPKKDYFVNARDNWDLLKLKAYLDELNKTRFVGQDLFFEIVLAQLWSSNKSYSDLIEGQMQMEQPLNAYGLAQYLFHFGHHDVLREILTDPLHEMDRIYLRYFAGNSLHFLADRYADLGESQSLLIDDYYEFLRKNMALYLHSKTCSPAQLAWIDELPARYQRLSEQFFPCFECSDFALLRHYAEIQNTDSLPMGSPGIFRLYPLKFGVAPVAGTAMPPRKVQAIDGRIQDATQEVKRVLLQVEQQIFRILLGQPARSYNQHGSEIIGWLKECFPNLSRMLQQPLSSEEQRRVQIIMGQAYKTRPELAIQVYQAQESPPVQQVLSERIQIANTGYNAVILPSGVLIIYDTANPPASIHEAGRRYKAGRFIPGGDRFFSHLRSIVDNQQWLEAMNQWRSLGGQSRLMLDDPGSLKLNIANCVKMNFNPHITVLVENNQKRTYYPVAVGEAGFYLHLHQPYEHQPQIRTIVTGSCRHGGSLIGIAQTLEGRREYVLTDRNQPLPQDCISLVIESEAIHPDELVYLYSQRALMVFYKQFHTPDKPLKFRYQTLFSNYLLNLLPLLWQGKMTASAFVQAAQLLLNKERMMADALRGIAIGYDYQFEQTSSLDALGFAKWLDEEPDSFLANILKFLNIEDYQEKNYTNAQLEEMVAAHIIDFLSTDKAINANHSQVWQFIQSNLADIQAKRELSGLALINILDYCAQFAVSQLEDPTTMVAVQSRESPLLETYNSHFSSHFAAVVELLWIDPFQLYSEESHHMVYHLKDDLGTFNDLIQSSFADLASMVAAIALDDGTAYIHAMRAATTRLGFFANKQPSPAQEPTLETLIPAKKARTGP